MTTSTNYPIGRNALWEGHSIFFGWVNLNNWLMTMQLCSWNGEQSGRHMLIMLHGWHVRKSCIERYIWWIIICYNWQVLVVWLWTTHFDLAQVLNETLMYTNYNIILRVYFSWYQNMMRNNRLNIQHYYYDIHVYTYM